MKIYLIPGLGFDHRIFRNLDFANVELNYLDWIEPLPREAIQDYAKRLAQDIQDQGEKTVLIGHSLGGMMSQEIACLKNIDQIILISSIQSRAELPFYFKIIRPLALQYLFSKELTLSSFRFWGAWQDYDTREQQDLFKDMVRQQSNRYLRWALWTLSSWKRPPIPSHTKIVQIHGDRDKTLPFSLVKNADHVIRDAGHFMVFKHQEKISQIIADVLK